MKSALWTTVLLLGCSDQFLSNLEKEKTALLTPLTTPQMLLPLEGYQSTSHFITAKANAATQATSYVFEALQGGAVVSTSTIQDTTAILTLPAGIFGTFQIRVRYLASDGRSSENSVARSVILKDFAAGTLVKSINFTARATCGSCSIFAVVGCPGVNFPFTCPGAPNDNFSSCQTDSIQGAGNGWICGADPDENFLGVSNSNTGTYLPQNVGMNDLKQDSSIEASIYLANHVNGATDEALILSCRVRVATECGTAHDSGVSLFYYPYRDPTTADNVELRYRDCSGTWANLAAERVTALNGIGRAWNSKMTARLDCLGNHVTAYFKSGADYLPIAAATDSANLAGRSSFGIGPGGATNLHMRVAALNWREFP